MAQFLVDFGYSLMLRWLLKSSNKNSGHFLENVKKQKMTNSKTVQCQSEWRSLTVFVILASLVSEDSYVPCDGPFCLSWQEEKSNGIFIPEILGRSLHRGLPVWACGRTCPWKKNPIQEPTAASVQCRMHLSSHCCSLQCNHLMQQLHPSVRKRTRALLIKLFLFSVFCASIKHLQC